MADPIKVYPAKPSRDYYGVHGPKELIVLVIE